MSEREPFYFKLLEKLGFNMTRLRWKFYKLEQKREQLKKAPVVPERLKWLTFRHKICQHCGAVNDRNDRACYKCERRLPSLLGYRIARLFGFVIPSEAPHAILLFGVLSVFLFALNFILEGKSALFSPSGEALYMLGAWSIDANTRQFEWWRAMTFGVVHSGIIHIGFNGYAMKVLANVTEAHLGLRRTLVLITASQLGAAVATWMWYLQLNQESVFTMGASGWVSGLLGYAIVYTWSMGPAGKTYRSQLIQWAIYIVLFGFFMGANNAGHIGGALAGAAVGAIHNRRSRETAAEAGAWDAAFWVSAAVWIVCLGAQVHYFVQHIGDFGT